MNRWTSRRGPGADDDDRRRNRRAGDDVGTPGAARGDEQPNDKSDMFQAPPSGEIPEGQRLREPRASNRSLRDEKSGRAGKRLTARELMAQMSAADEADDEPAEQRDSAPPQRSAASRERTTPPRPAAPRPASPRTAPAADAPQRAKRPPRPKAAPTGNDVTQKIPPVTGPSTPGASEPVDLSDSATTRRVIEESRGQDPHSGQPPSAANETPAPTWRSPDQDQAGDPSAKPASPKTPAPPPGDERPTQAIRNVPLGSPDPRDRDSTDPRGRDDTDHEDVDASSAEENLPGDNAPTELVPLVADSPSDAPSEDNLDDAAADGDDGSTDRDPADRDPADRERGPRTVGRADSQRRSAPRTHPRSEQRDQPSLRRRATVTGRVLVALACVTALVGTGVVWGYVQSLDGNWRQVLALPGDDENVRNLEGQYGDENYLIVGTDTRAGSNSEVGAGTTADAEGARSDTVILVNIPADRSRVVAVSFPRDLQVDRPECEQWDNEEGTYSGSLDPGYGVKLNSVYAEGGPQCLVRVITQMSGLKINRFIAMDFAGFREVVDVIGGVEVCSTQPLYDYELGQILRRPGKQTLNANRALDYVRARNIASEGNGDYGRIKRQQLFMSSLLRSTLSGDVLTNPNKLNNIVNTFVEYSFVDGVDTRSLVQLAESMQGIDAGRVTFLTIPTSGTTEDGLYNEIPRTDDINAIFDAIIDDQPLPGEHQTRPEPENGGANNAGDANNSDADSGGNDGAGDAPAPEEAQAPEEIQATASDPSIIPVRVLNGTGTPGLAAQLSDQFALYGFGSDGIADASENRADTVVRYAEGEENSAATVASMLPGATIQLDRTVQYGVHVILGTDYDGTLNPAPASGQILTVTKQPRNTNPSNLPNDLAITNAGDSTCG